MMKRWLAVARLGGDLGARWFRLRDNGTGNGDLAAALARHRRLAEELHAMIRRGERIGFAPIRFELEDLEAALVERGIPLRQLSEAARARPEAAAGIPPTDDGGRARPTEA